MAMLKVNGGKSFTHNTVKVFYVPSFNDDKESAVITCGHHCLQDGVTQFQAFFKASDEVRDGKKIYPFIKKNLPGFFFWILHYAIFFPFGAGFVVYKYM